MAWVPGSFVLKSLYWLCLACCPDHHLYGRGSRWDVPASLRPISDNIYPPAMVEDGITGSSLGGTHGHVPMQSTERQAGQVTPRPLNPPQSGSFHPLWNHILGDCPGNMKAGTPASQTYQDVQVSTGSTGQRERKRGQLKRQVGSVLLRANRTDDGIAGSCICF